MEKIQEMKFKVEKADDGKNLEAILRNHSFSRRLIVKLKRTEKGLLVNEKPARTVDKVHAGDVVSVHEAVGKVLEANGELEVEILYEDGDVVVFNKPPFMPVHPSIKHQGDTLGNFFAAHCEGMTFRPVNRLDRNTSGCVLCAKNQRAAFVLQRSCEKVYYGITSEIKLAGGRIFAPIAREQNSIIRRCVRQDGQEAATVFRVIKRKNGRALCEFVLETGRTHQIRVHMAYIGCALEGDDMYGGDCSQSKRQKLHCGEISFIRPSDNKLIKLFAPLPQDMKI